MNAESGDDEKDGLTGEWEGKSRQDWRVARLTKWNWKLISKTKWRISKCAICDFQWGDGWWARNSDHRWAAGTARGWREIMLRR